MSHSVRSHFFHVTYDAATQSWQVKEIRGEEVKIFKKKDDAIKEANKMAKEISLGHVVVHNERGKFESFSQSKRII
jgi:hypothetical protein